MVGCRAGENREVKRAWSLVRGPGTGERIKNKMMVERSRVDKEEMNNFDDSDKMAMVEKEEFNDCDRRHIDDKIEGGDQDDGGEEEL